MNRLKILYLIHKDDANRFVPWGEDVLSAIGGRHDVTCYDFSAPVRSQLCGVDIVIDHGGSYGTREIMACAESVKLWCVAGTGLDHVDIDYLRSKKIPVVNCPGQFSSISLAECAMMYILMLTRNYSKCLENLHNRVLYRPFGSELVGRKLGIIGFGSSGVELARRAKAFGIKILAIDTRKIEPEVIEEIDPEFIGKPEDIDFVLQECDYVSLHLHLNGDTCQILDSRRINLMRRHAFLINVARGALVDEEALFAAIREGKIAGAGLDVFSNEPLDPSHPVFELPNVIVTPHISGSTDGTSLKRAQCIAENIDLVAQGMPPLYRVD